MPSKTEETQIALAVKSYLDSALDVPVAYLHATMSPDKHAQNANPFEVEFYWDEPEFGSIAKLDLREDLLDKFNDDPEHYKESIRVAEKAMRAFADELAGMLEKLK